MCRAIETHLPHAPPILSEANDESPALTKRRLITLCEMDGRDEHVQFALALNSYELIKCELESEFD